MFHRTKRVFTAIACRLFRQWRLRTPTSAATQTAIIACGSNATTTGTDAGGSPNTAITPFTAVRVAGYAMRMGTGVILNTLAGGSIRTTSTMTTTTVTATANGSASTWAH